MSDAIVMIKIDFYQYSEKKTFKTLSWKSESVNISQTDDNIMTNMKNDKQSSKKHYTEN